MIGAYLATRLALERGAALVRWVLAAALVLMALSVLGVRWHPTGDPTGSCGTAAGTLRLCDRSYPAPGTG
jgi:hypothetical protein